MKNKRKNYTAKEKEKVLALMKMGESVSSISSRLNIPSQNIYNWKANASWEETRSKYPVTNPEGKVPKRAKAKADDNTKRYEGTMMPSKAITPEVPDILMEKLGYMNITLIEIHDKLKGQNKLLFFILIALVTILYKIW